MSLTAYITATPLDSGYFKDIYSSIREFKIRFKERFELDHYMGGVLDDTDPTCEGYHKQLTMNGGEYNASNIPTTIPSCPTGGIVFFSIGGELCCYDGTTAKQITEGGGIAIDDPVNETSGVSTGLRACCYGGGIYVAVGTSGKILTSPDGTTWTSRTSGVSTEIWGCCYGNSLYVATCTDGTILTSPDGTTWTSRTSGVSTRLTNVCYGNGIYVVTGNSGVILTSSDGTTWTSRTSGVTTTLRGSCYSNGIFVVIGYSTTTILTSPDGTTWTSRTPGTSTYLYSVACGADGNRFIAVGLATILSSTDGITWDSESASSTESLYGCCKGDAKYIVVGSAGEIISIPLYKTLE